MKLHIHLTAALVTAGLFAPLSAAQAVDISRNPFVSASGICVPATFTVAHVRNRPQGIRNESSNLLYVTCATTGNYSSDPISSIEMKVTNHSGVSATINCTMFAGIYLGTGSTPTQGGFPVSTVVTANNYAYFNWSSNALTGSVNNIKNPQWSCALPPGTEIRHIGIYYPENVGA